MLRNVLLPLRHHVAAAGLSWGFVETFILLVFTFGGGFINQVAGDSGGCVPPSNVSICPGVQHGSAWLSLAGLLIILGLAFVMGFSIADQSGAIIAFFISQTVSFTLYFLTFWLIPFMLLNNHSFLRDFVIFRELLLLGGFMILSGGGVLTVLASVLGERHLVSRGRRTT